MPTTLLIVDDHAGFRKVARDLLSAAGFDVAGEASDSASALAEVAHLHPDVVLLDVQLPGIDGFAIARQLAELPDPPTVVLTSTRSKNSYRDRLAQCPARGFIPKQDLSGDGLAALLSAP
jgi:DNA-binding NarL/FixJ family response regulator